MPYPSRITRAAAPGKGVNTFSKNVSLLCGLELRGACGAGALDMVLVQADCDQNERVLVFPKVNRNLTNVFIEMQGI